MEHPGHHAPHPQVAPLAGSVDRNQAAAQNALTATNVAPLAGSVDRNNISTDRQTGLSRSLPSRGAWIEMPYLASRTALGSRSLPSRGAWIEMVQNLANTGLVQVAPLAGSVDRNFVNATLTTSQNSRSPRGERG